MARTKDSNSNNNAHRAPHVPPKDAKAKYIKNYLIVYNAVSALAWSYLLFMTIAHLSGLTATSKLPPVKTAASTVSRFASFIPFIKKSVPLTTQFESHLPSFLLPIVNRARTLYMLIGPQTTWIQTFAILEVFHSLLGWVRAPLQTTLMQVASRYYAVWILTENFDECRTNALFASMVFAWSLTEVVRYSFFASSLLGKEPYILLYLRYTMFYILYPLGASSEAFLNYATLPPSSGIGKWWGNKWNVNDYIRAILFFVWWPSLYVLYTHMMVQRRRVLGNKVKAN